MIIHKSENVDMPGAIVTLFSTALLHVIALGGGGDGDSLQCSRICSERYTELLHLLTNVPCSSWPPSVALHYSST